MLNNQKHKDVIIKILKDIYLDISLGPLLGFKGGTAAMLFYGLDRFSVDLDFDLLNPEKEDYVFEKISKILNRYGKLNDATKKYYTLFFELNYENYERNLKIEINRRSFGSRYNILNFFGISMQVMAKKDIFANKLAAMYERGDKTNRDIYDVWFFLQNGWPINKELIEKRLNLKIDDVIKKSLSRLEKLTDRPILSGMGELLDDRQKAWVKTNLRKETIFMLKVMLDNYSKG